MMVCTMRSYVEAYFAGFISPFVLFFVFGAIALAINSSRSNRK